MSFWGVGWEGRGLGRVQWKRKPEERGDKGENLLKKQKGIRVCWMLVYVKLYMDVIL